ncbi:MAG: DUF5666 domain-containing protein [bacterium]
MAIATRIFFRSWVAIIAFLLIGLGIGCGGGGGTTPPPGDQGTVNGTLVIDPNLPLVPAGDGSRVGVRVIDPSDTIASIGLPAKTNGSGTFSIPNVKATAKPLYLEVVFTPGRSLQRVAAQGSTPPVTIHIPIQVAANGTANVTLALGSALAGPTAFGLTLSEDYSGADGLRDQFRLLNFQTDTVSADLNHDGSADDGLAPDNDNDSLRDDRNLFDDNPVGFTEIEREGTVNAITADTITIIDTIFTISGDTSIFDHDSSAKLQLSDFNVGDAAKAKGFKTATGTDVAAIILERRTESADDDPVDPPSGGRENEREGFTLTAKTATTVTIGGITFQVTPTTLIENKETGAPLTLADLLVGQCVDVKSKPVGTDQIATRLRFDPTCEDSPDDYEVESKGPITGLTGNTVTVNGFTFEVDESTMIENEQHLAIPFNTLVLADFVEVHGRQTPTQLLATRIERENAGEGEGSGGEDVRAEGIITSKGANTLTMEGITFMVVPNTHIEDKDHNPVLFADIQLNETGRIEGHEEAGVNIADDIELDRESGG